MSIVTKKGDKGKTDLWQGSRVNKDHIRIEVCGTLDELSSYLGLSKSMIKHRQTKKIIEDIQKNLFILGTEIVTETKSLNKLKRRVDSSFIGWVDKIIKGLEEEKNLKISCFQIPGENTLASSLDICRAVTRRAERRAITLSRRKLLKNKYILAYLNRLSDLFYLLARKFEWCR